MSKVTTEPQKQNELTGMRPSNIYAHHKSCMNGDFCTMLSASRTARCRKISKLEATAPLWGRGWSHRRTGVQTVSSST